MSEIGFVGPVKNVDAARAFASELKGGRRAEYVAALKRMRCTRERVFLAESPMGPMIMAYRESTNAGFHMATIAASSNSFDKFYIESIGKIVGADPMSMPAGPPPHLAFEWDGGQRARSCTMIAAPVPDPSKFWKMCREMSMRVGEHRESRESVGLCLERAFYMHDAKMAVVYLEGSDPHAALGQTMTSTSNYDRWFSEQLTAVHGIDFKNGVPPKPELLVLFDA